MALQSAAVATPPRFSAGAAGVAGSKDALARLNEAVAELRAFAIQPILQQAISALNAGDHKAGGDWALKALQQDERSGLAWYLLAFSREKAGDFASSVQCYESALSLLPEHAEVANDLGRLAFRMGMLPQSEQLFRHFLARHPDHVEGANNLACAVRELGRPDEAVEILRAAIVANPEAAMLWNALGTVVSEQGDFETARIFFEEALRLDAGFAKARYNLGNSRLALGDAGGALADCEAAMALPVGEDERQMMRLARSTTLIALGRIQEGWEEYQARLHPQFAGVTHFQVDRPQWAPGMDLAGRSLLVLGEQGLGDEVLFANVLADVAQALGPEGKLTLAVEKRLVGLFQRSFPEAVVGEHATYSVAGRTARFAHFVEDPQAIDLWAPIADLLRQYRTSVAAFPARERFLTPDPARVAHWRRVLKRAPGGRKVGLLWKSGMVTSARQRFFSPFEAWRPILAMPGVSFVSLQYGDCSVELDEARRRLGVEIWTPPGIDLKQDLDDVAALCCAVDLVLGFSNATLNLGAACGAPTWLISTPAAWPRLGSDRYPWYPQAKVFAPATYGAWDAVMAEIAGALARFVAGPER
ncbi:tetratricopeptide repeat protein [Phenylobacterium sp.]|uniref:tetratricopeptide repeat-containing glycosyltransferase family protein n=1 Tax=Phenylobacterium sp. TaxID=1871053 RepID=UPI002F3E8F58